MSFSSVESFEQCITTCDATKGCIDVSFQWPNACYLKNKLTAMTDNVSVWTARRKTTASSDTTDKETPAKQALSCHENASNGVKYTSAKGTFLVECGVDYGYAPQSLYRCNY